jgi:putative NADH-flavin reductase
MRLALLGATGGIGGHVLDWALDAGHTVHALARRPGDLGSAALPPAAGLAVTAGDALDPVAVAEVIAEADAVVSALGPRGASSPDLLAGAAANIVAGMEKTGARRLVCVSAAGAFIAADPHMNWLVKQILPRVFAKQFAGTRRMEDVVGRSGLDWTMVRATRLTNGPGTGRYRVGPDYPPRGGWKISRADVAEFIAGVVTEGSWVRSAPALAY